MLLCKCSLIPVTVQCNLRKDKYNKKLMKYHVEIEEGDESLDEEIDRVHEEECEEAFSPHPKPLPSKCF